MSETCKDIKTNPKDTQGVQSSISSDPSITMKSMGMNEKCVEASGGAGGKVLWGVWKAAGAASTSSGCETFSLVMNTTEKMTSEISCIINSNIAETTSNVTAIQKIEQEFSNIKGCKLAINQEMDLSVSLSSTLSSQSTAAIKKSALDSMKTVADVVSKASKETGAPASGAKSVVAITTTIDDFRSSSEIDEMINKIYTDMVGEQTILFKVDGWECNRAEGDNEPDFAFDQTMVVKLISAAISTKIMSKFVETTKITEVGTDMGVTTEMTSTGVAGISKSLGGDNVFIIVMGIVLLIALVIGGLAAAKAAKKKGYM